MQMKGKMKWEKMDQLILEQFKKKGKGNLIYIQK